MRLTTAIDAGLDAVTVQADSHAALDLIARAEDIFTANDEQPLAREFELRRRFIEGYHYLRTNDPKRLEKLESAVTRFISELRRARIDVHELKPRIDMGRVFRVLVLLPIALIGAIVNYPAYRLVRVLALRFAKGEGAVTATMKVLAALVLYPLTYIAAGAVVGWRFGWEAGVATVLALPVVAYLALVVFEDLDDIIGDARALGHRLFRRYGYESLIAQREEIKRDILAVARDLGVR
jgi:hypothetical protein